MLFSSPKFIIQSYQDWYISLVAKDVRNTDVIMSGAMQDISVIGMMHRIMGWSVSNLYVVVPAALLIVSPLLRTKQYRFIPFRLSYLAIVLLSVVLFSTASESSTYIIAMAGVGIWYVLREGKKSKTVLVLLVLALILTSLSPTDLFPQYINVHYVRAYSLKALPPFLVWIWLMKEVFIKDFAFTKMQPV